MNMTYEEYLSKNKPNRNWIWILTVMLIVVLIWAFSGISGTGGSGNTSVIARNMIRGLVNPDRDLLFNFQQGVPYLLFETIAIAFLGTIIGGVFAIPLAFLSSRNVVPKVVSSVTKVLAIGIRTIPSLVYGLMFIRVTGPGPFAGVMTMSVISIGMLTKLFTDAIEDIDEGVVEALESMGFTTWEKIRHGIIPQLNAAFLSTILYRFDMNLRDATTLGLVGAGGIGAPLTFAINGYSWSEVGAILLGLIIMVLLIETFSTRIRKKIMYG